MICLRELYEINKQNDSKNKNFRTYLISLQINDDKISSMTFS